MNTPSKQVIEEFISNFINENWQLNLDELIKNLSWLNKDMKKETISKLKDILFSSEISYNNLKQIFDKLRETEKTKELVELLTIYELQYIFGFMKEEERKKIDVDSLINYLSWENKQYYQAVKEYYLENYDAYEQTIEKLALTWFEPAVKSYVSMLFYDLKEIKNDYWNIADKRKKFLALHDNLNDLKEWYYKATNMVFKQLNKEVKQIEQKLIKLAEKTKLSAPLWDFYYEIWDYKQAETAYQKWILNWEKECYVLLAGLYDFLAHRWNKDTDKKVLEVLDKYERRNDLESVDFFDINKFRWYYFLERKDLESAKYYFNIAYDIAKINNFLKEQEEIWKILIEKLFDLYSEDKIALILQDISNLNQDNAKYSIMFYRKTKNKLWELAIAIHYTTLWESKYLIQFLDDLFLEKIGNLDYSSLLDIVNEEEIKENAPQYLLWETNLKTLLEIDDSYIDKTRLESLLSDINTDNETMTWIVINFSENEALKLDEVERLWKKYDYDYEYDESIDMEKYLSTLSNKIVDRLETIVDILNIYILRKGIKKGIKKLWWINHYQVFSLFNLLEPKDNSNVESVLDYFSTLSEFYDSWMEFINLWFYSYIKRFFLRWLPNKKKVDDYLRKLEISILWNQNKELYVLDIGGNSFMLEILEKILRFEKLENKDMKNIAVLLSHVLLKDNRRIKSWNWLITGETSFTITPDGLVPVNKLSNNGYLPQFEVYIKKDNKWNSWWNWWYNNV